MARPLSGHELTLAWADRLADVKQGGQTVDHRRDFQWLESPSSVIDVMREVNYENGFVLRV
jgi:hypothetical protein